MSESIHEICFSMMFMRKHTSVHFSSNKIVKYKNVHPSIFLILLRLERELRHNIYSHCTDELLAVVYL